MSDNLRDRIAAILSSKEVVLDGDYINRECAWLLADAVIQELGLQTHLAKRIINGKPDQRVRRHVTDWEIVNE
jgi:hypothetical protein